MGIEVIQAEVEAGEYKTIEKGSKCERRAIGLVVRGITREGKKLERQLLMISKSNAQDLQDQLRKLLRRMI